MVVDCRLSVVGLWLMVDGCRMMLPCLCYKNHWNVKFVKGVVTKNNFRKEIVTGLWQFFLD